MSEQPVIGVIIPLYNAADTMECCLQSVITSSVEDIEVICINDGSTDRSGEIRAVWAQKDSRIKVFALKNSGVSAARNAALKVCMYGEVCDICGCG